MNVEKFRKLLLAERDRLERQRRGIDNQDSESSQSDETSELSDYDQHPADAATTTFQRSQDFAIGETLEDAIKQIDAALHKIDDGTYGICDRCRQPIAPARLQALPYAIYCIDCAERVGGTP